MEFLFYGFVGVYDGDVGDFFLEGEFIVGVVDGGGDGVGDGGEVVEVFFDEEVDDVVGVEDEVVVGGGVVVDDVGVFRNKLVIGEGRREWFMRGG